MAKTTRELTELSGHNRAAINRYVKMRIIPKPTYDLHQSGRGGKVAYYPDYVVDTLLELKELRGKGYSLTHALAQMQANQINRVLKNVQLKYTESLRKGSVTFKNGTEVDLVRLFEIFIMADVEPLIQDREELKRVLKRIRENQEQIIEDSFRHVSFRHNPVLVLRESEVQVVTDFMLSHMLAENPEERNPMMVIPLLPAVHSIIKIGSGDMHFKLGKFTKPAPLIWDESKKGDTLQHKISVAKKGAGFRVYKETAKVIKTK